MPKKRIVTLTEEQKTELESYRDHDKSPQVRERCAAILKNSEGKSVRWVARNGLLKKRRRETISQWLRWYEEAGVAGLVANRQGGNRRNRLRQGERI